MQNEPPNHTAEIDFSPPASRLSHQRRALLRLWNLAKRHPLTRDRIPPSSTEDVEQDIFATWSNIIPAASTDQLHRILQEGEYSFFRANAADDTTRRSSPIVTSTGGSTGKPKLLVNTYAEVLHDAFFQGKSYRLAGITPDDRVATFGGSGTYATDYSIYHALGKIGCTIVPINDFRRAEENCEILETLRVTVLLVLPSKLYPLLSHLEDRGRTLKDVRLIVTGGEPVSDQLKRRAMHCIGAHLALGSTFRTTDHGAIGYQCAHCGDGEYHLHEELQYVELIGSEEGGANELVVSNLFCTYMPIVRLQSGDWAEWSDNHERCRCGRTSRKIKIRGRTADIIMVGGEKINGQLFSKLPERAGVHENLIQVSLQTGNDGVDRIEIALDDAVRARFEDKLRSILMADPVFSTMIRERRAFGPIFVPRHEGTETTRGYGKLRVFRDLRG
jgi:phenylacetate-coenzyme A ligase PaaK-like adenylate-forming protein